MRIMRIYKNKYSLFLGIFCANVAFFILAAWLLPIRYETSDDVAMWGLLRGLWEGWPATDHLIFQSVLYGKFLTLLYNLYDGVEWYPVMMSISQIVAMTIVCYHFYTKTKDKNLIIPVIVLFYVCWIYLICRFQFTSTTAILALSSVVLLLDKKFIAGGLLFVFATLMRFESAMMMGLLLAPLFVYRYKTEICKCWAPLALILVVAFSLKFVDRQAYHNSSWKEFISYNSARSALQDNPCGWRGFKGIPDGISKNDYELLVYDFCFDAEVWTIDKLSEMSGIVNATPLKYKFKDSFFDFIKPNWINMFFMLVLTITVFVVIQDKRKCILWGGAVVLWMAVLCMVGIVFQIKPYVFFSSLMAMFYLYGYILSENGFEKWRKAMPWILLLYIVPLCKNIYATVKHNNQIMESAIEARNLIHNIPRDMAVLAYAYPMQGESPFTMTMTILPYAFLTHDDFSFESLLEEKNVLLVDKDAKLPGKIILSLWEHNGINARCRVILESEHKQVINLYRYDIE